MKKHFFSLIIIFVGTVLSFQNCSQQSFSEIENEENKNSISNYENQNSESDSENISTDPYYELNVSKEKMDVEKNITTIPAQQKPQGQKNSSFWIGHAAGSFINLRDKELKPSYANSGYSRAYSFEFIAAATSSSFKKINYPINNGNREIWGHVGRMSMIDNLTGRSATSLDMSISKTPGDFSIPIKGTFFWSLVPFEKVDFALLGYNPSSALSAKKQTVFLIPGERYYFNVRLKKEEEGLEIVWTGQLFL